ncbi:MAG: glutathione S-transferase [Gilliamella sp.]|uniref:glutathione S-transferase family protein n=1 Tax=Gilliamella sp. TaxID=1891236 RepID=UPI00261D8B50|nr:glutathione S-transferase [Gilliamella sp.]MCO6552317.1 glutathione S-transferase [Gilliamella sp.]
MNYKLYIGNKNYSTWSMRPWVVMKHFGIPFDEKFVRFDNLDDKSAFKATVSSISKYGTVPILVDNDVVISDSLAICEYLAEKHPNLALWPIDTKKRANARSLVAKMHSGFSAIRKHLPMNIEAEFFEIGQIILRDHADVKNEISLVDELLSSFLNFNLPQSNYLFGEFTIADAFYAPMCLRLKNFGIKISATLTNYINTICQTHSVKEWISEAMQEKDFIVVDEPYRLHR